VVQADVDARRRTVVHTAELPVGVKEPDLDDRIARVRRDQLGP
jgi:hypothetical protein